jgi:hypothetical protein
MIGTPPDLVFTFPIRKNTPSTTIPIQPNSMPPFEGDGGKKRKRIRKPSTPAGITLNNSLNLERQHALLSQQPQQHPSSHLTPQERNSTPFELQPVDQMDIGDNQTPQSPDGNSSTDPQVTSLIEYFRSEGYKNKRAIEDKHWEEVYGDMFSWFNKCATKTSDWGNADLWNHDWKERCLCDQTRCRLVVLVDLLSELFRG